MTEPRGEPGAVLRPAAAEDRISIGRHHPRPALRRFVDYLWVVRWDVDEPFTQQVVTQPKVHLVAEEGRVLVYGVARQLFSRTLSGTGRAVGAAFRPGGFRPFLPAGVAVNSLADTVLTAEELWELDDAAVAQEILASEDEDRAVGLLEDLLESRRPAPDPVVDQVVALVQLIESQPSMRQVADLAAASGTGVRALQRLFGEYVGAGPKWVIQRRRLLDAAARVHEGESVSWADLAYELGYSDQSHLVRDFTAAVGQPPAAYATSATDSAEGA